ncbi:MAG: hypothetical protein A2X94_17210 [Bdellovibrionales bacterium GWB1_55_8]|nr:MAG: hypothetical protein A2X94_17210 [Bdellovibrionales bacterium GWB1_55_8]
MESRTPDWLNFLERRLRWLAIPNIAVLFVTMQAAGYLFVTMDARWIERLALLPDRVLMEGEFWRLLTFLSLPLSLSPIWVIFVLWFLYFILNTIEDQWGAFKTTLYVLVSVLLMVVFSLVTGYPITNIAGFESTLFLAAATLFPEFEVRLFLLLPVKMKWLAWLTAFFVVIQVMQGGWLDRAFLLAIYSNYVLFFGPVFLSRVRQARRRARFRRQMGE